MKHSESRAIKQKIAELKKQKQDAKNKALLNINNQMYTVNMEKEKKEKEEKYTNYQHGLLFIVHKKLGSSFGGCMVEDSRWTEEEKAKEHCRILNENK